MYLRWYIPAAFISFVCHNFSRLVSFPSTFVSEYLTLILQPLLFLRLLHSLLSCLAHPFLLLSFSLRPTGFLRQQVPPYLLWPVVSFLPCTISWNARNSNEVVVQGHAFSTTRVSQFFLSFSLFFPLFSPLWYLATFIEVLSSLSRRPFVLFVRPWGYYHASEKGTSGFSGFRQPRNGLNEIFRGQRRVS